MELWNYFKDLRQLRADTTSEEEWSAILAMPKWASFIQWYPTIAGYAATRELAQRHVDSVRFMVDQLHRMETDETYTQAHADAAMDYYSHTSWVNQCPKLEHSASSSAKK